MLFRSVRPRRDHNDSPWPTSTGFTGRIDGWIPATLSRKLAASLAISLTCVMTPASAFDGSDRTSAKSAGGAGPAATVVTSQRSIPENTTDSYRPIAREAYVTPVIRGVAPGPADIDGNSAENLTSSYLKQQPWIDAKVKRGDTLSQIFNRHDLASKEAYAIAELDAAAPLLKIRPGEIIRIKQRPDGNLGVMEYQISRFETLRLSTETGDYVFETLMREPEVRINNARATIYSNLLSASSEAGVSLSTMYNFVALFGWQVDFTMDLQPGDHFSLIYEEQYLDEEKVGDGEIIAAELVISGKTLRAIRFVDDEGFTHYYAPNGDGIKGTFLRTPVKFAQVTSSFSKSRLHPIKKVWRAHKGVDYGAPRGTPVMATGNGTVKIARRENGYGKTIILRHGGKYETLYAHLSGYAKGIKQGVRVQQGDVIGYVGSTGLATGPHLHYEFRIHGIHKNPVTVELPKSASIDPDYLSGFKQLASRWSGELDYLNRIALAQNLATE